MDEAVFLDKSHMPEDADLSKVLGRAKRHWDSLKEHALNVEPGASPKWTYESKKSGWTFAVRGKRRNLLYLKPFQRRFTAGFALGDGAVQAAEQSSLPATVIQLIRQAPKYPEGRAVRIEVATAADVRIAKKLLAIKLEN